MPRGAKYRLIAVDRPGYMGAQEVYPKKEEALGHAEVFVRTHAPRAPAHFVASHDQRAYVLVEEFYRNGDHYTVAKWDDDHGVWKKTHGNPTSDSGQRSSSMASRSEALSVEKSVLDGITFAYWAEIYIREQEEKAERTGKRTPWGPGEQIDPYIPKKVPAYVKAGAKEFAAILKHQNRTNLYGLYLMAESAPGKHRRQPDPFDFGYTLAMQAMGHGVSWFDDHPDFDIKIPHYEVYG